MYTKVSIPKNGEGAGCPAPKSSSIVLIDVDDIATEPTRTLGNTAVVGDLTLNADAKAVKIYGTPSTIEVTEENSGDPDAKGVMSGVVFEHPGDSVAIRNFAEAYANKGIVALVTECDGTAAGRVRMIGRKCNPLYLAIETTNNNTSNKRKFTYKQGQLDRFFTGDYAGAMPAIAADTATTEGA